MIVGKKMTNDALGEMSEHDRQRFLIESLNPLPEVAHTSFKFEGKKKEEIEAPKEKKEDKFSDPKERQFVPLYYGILKDHKLTLTERILYSLIHSYDQSSFHCYATNRYLSDLIGVTERSVTRMIGKLESLNKIEILERNKNKRIIKSKYNEENKS
jgi:hypothetical protein